MTAGQYRYGKDGRYPLLTGFVRILDPGIVRDIVNGHGPIRQSLGYGTKGADRPFVQIPFTQSKRGRHLQVIGLAIH